MGDVIQAFSVVTMDQKRIYELMEKRIVEAVQDAKRGGVPQGLIVALLHGYAQHETKTMMDDA